MVQRRDIEQFFKFGLWYNFLFKIIPYSTFRANLKIIVICISRAKSASFRFESEFSGRGAAEASKQARTKGTFWQRCTLHFIGNPTNYKSKDIIGNISIFFKFV
jgi:hypothetical protein